MNLTSDALETPNATSAHRLHECDAARQLPASDAGQLQNGAVLILRSGADDPFLVGEDDNL
jgi:hypothetical protein